MKIVEVGMMYGTIFLNSLLPVLTSAIERKDDKKTESLMKHAFILLFAFGAGISLFLTIFARDIIRLISTEEYIQTTLLGGSAVGALQIVAWIFLFYFLSSLFTYTMIAKSEQKRMMYINSFVALINILGNIICIPYFSFIGSAWVTLITQVFLLILTGYFGIRHLSFTWIVSRVGFILGGAFLAGGTSLLLTQNLSFVASSFFETFIKLSIAGGVFGIIYFGFLFLVKKIKLL